MTALTTSKPKVVPGTIRAADSPVISAEIIRKSHDWSSISDVDVTIQYAAAIISEVCDGPSALEQTVSIVLGDDELVRNLNKTYRKIDKATNVLSFSNPVKEAVKSDEMSHNLGDVVLAFETIDREARSLGRTFHAHLSHLIVHGILHLLGYDHQTDADACKMEEVEIYLLDKLGIVNPYHEQMQAE